MFGTLIIFEIVIILILIIAKAGEKLGEKKKVQNFGKPVYEAILFLSPAERSFFGVLQQAIASDYQIFAKVRLADIVRPIKNLSRSGWQSALNRIDRKHVDFALCDFERLEIVAAIELDDRSHEKFERGVRDNFVDAALLDAGIPILHVPARQAYSPAQIREQIQNILTKNKS